MRHREPQLVVGNPPGIGRCRGDACVADRWRWRDRSRGRGAGGRRPRSGLSCLRRRERECAVIGHRRRSRGRRHRGGARAPQAEDVSALDWSERGRRNWRLGRWAGFDGRNRRGCDGRLGLRYGRRWLRRRGRRGRLSGREGRWKQEIDGRRGRCSCWHRPVRGRRRCLLGEGRRDLHGRSEHRQRNDGGTKPPVRGAQREVDPGWPNDCAFLA